MPPQPETRRAANPVQQARARGPMPAMPVARGATSRRSAAVLLFGSVGFAAVVAAQAPGAAGVRAGIEWQRVGDIEIARTETTVAQFRRHVEATRTVTQAERQGGGEVFETGWTRKPGWNWRTPFGQGRAAGDAEPAVHVTYDEARAFCAWAGARLPTDSEWTRAAYTEQRAAPPAPFVTGRRYAYPTGALPDGAQCLADCGAAARARAVSHGAELMRGQGHARVTDTPAGVNGLNDMGGNVWEWVDAPVGGTGSAPRRTRGGSWWYGAAQMRENHLQDKPGDTAVVYIGFRCARSRP